jgi:hypothetical protein
MYALSYKDSEKTLFFVVCEVIIIENLRSANSGPQNPQFIAQHFSVPRVSFREVLLQSIWTCQLTAKPKTRYRIPTMPAEQDK